MFASDDESEEKNTEKIIKFQEPNDDEEIMTMMTPCDGYNIMARGVNM